MITAMLNIYLLIICIRLMICLYICVSILCNNSKVWIGVMGHNSNCGISVVTNENCIPLGTNLLKKESLYNVFKITNVKE